MSTLTTEQDAVANHDGGHALVLAVAGSGKSTTLIHRIGRLVEGGVEPSRILVLMFNKDARSDFDGKLRASYGHLGALPEVMTFHAFGLRLATRFVGRGMLPPARVLADDRTLSAMVRELLRDRNTTEAAEPIDPTQENVTEILGTLDLLKGELHVPGSPLPHDINPNFAALLPAFEEMRRAEGFRTFADMVYDPVRLMLEDADAARFAANRYDHILVDEFQDINSVQCQMVRILAGTRAAVMAVGDDDQTIYRFRGARPDYLVSQFEQMFPGALRYKLSRTFRFGHEVALIANRVIRNNLVRTDKTCIPGTEQQTPVECIMHPDQGGQICSVIQEWMKARALSDVAILVREFAHTVSVERSLIAAGIPYRVQGALPFFDRKIVMGLRANLQLACGGFEALPAHRRESFTEALLGLPNLFLPAKLRRVVASRISKGISPSVVATEAVAALKNEPGYRTRAIDSAGRVWKSISQRRADELASDVLRDVIAGHDLINHFSKVSASKESAAEKAAMVSEVLTMAKGTGMTVGAFLAYLNELSDFAADAAAVDGVLITSIHRSKGLEWALVIVPELMEGKFPSSAGSPIEDERRLFYVAATRAKERLILAAPLDSQLVAWAKADKRGHPPTETIKASRFLFEARLGSSRRDAESLQKLAPVAIEARYTQLVA